jgi:RNA polymerase sigma factor (sigma-70 family)
VSGSAPAVRRKKQMTLEALLHEQHEPLIRRLRRMVGPDRAEDLRQDVFERAWRAAPRDVGPERQRAWLHRTAANLAIDELRRRRVRGDHVALEAAHQLAAPAAGEPTDPDAAAADAALTRLTPHERLVLLLRFQAGLSHRELAALLDVSEEAARKRVARARGAFARALRAERGDAPPLILLLATRADPRPFERWLRAAGARVRALERDDFDRQLLRADGVVTTHSHDDIHPALYGERPRHDLPGIDIGRDRRDVAVLRAALAQDVPVVGICRGHQILNIALGGSLYQDIETEAAAALSHRSGMHELRTRPGTLGRRVLGRRASVFTEHHQAARRIGRGLQPGAEAPDGIVEMLELPGHRMVLGLQWRPEDPRSGEAGRSVAEALVTEAARRPA